MEVRTIRNDELYHHGVKGQRWGVRRYQNPDGTLTDKGRKKYLKKFNKLFSKDEYGEWESNSGKQEHKLVDKFGLESAESIKTAKKVYEKQRGLMDKASKLDNDGWNKEYQDFDNLLKKAKCKYQADELRYSDAQVYCLNRGINPIDYAKKVKKAEDRYFDTLKTETSKILGDIGDKPIPNENYWHKDVKTYTADIIRRRSLMGDYFTSDMLEDLAYAEDTQIMKELAKAAKKK